MNEVKRIMVLGASVLQKPLIDKIKEKGHYLGVIDYNPKAVGAKDADEFFCVSTIDEEAVYQAAKSFRADAIVTMATDMPMRAIAYASAKLGLKAISYDTALRATDKALMIQALAEENVPHPWFFVLRDPGQVAEIREKLVYPCICKPIDSSGSRGVHLIRNAEELEESIRYSSSSGRSGAVIVEEYMQGQEISVEILCMKGTAHILAITEKLTTGAPGFVELGHSQPGRFSDEMTARIEKTAAAACRTIGIEDGAAHVEIMITEDGPKIVELGARMGGDFITSDLVPLSTGLDMIWLMVEIALGKKPVIDQPQKRGAAIRYFMAPEGKLRAVYHLDEARRQPGVEKIDVTVSPGDEITAIRSSGDRIGQVITSGETIQQAIENAERVISMVIFDVEKDD